MIYATQNTHQIDTAFDILLKATLRPLYLETLVLSINQIFFKWLMGLTLAACQGVDKALKFSWQYLLKILS